MLNTTFNGLIIPHVYKLEGNQISVMSIKTRSLFWGGKINLSWGSWALRYGNLTTFIPYTDYPYVGTLDNPYTPTFDLNFAVPKEIYIDTYPAYTWTSANLGTDYWDDYLNRISDKNSRIVRMNLFLDEEDINSFDWRCPIIVDGAKYLVNKIENYDILSRKTTLVELILI